MLWIQRQAVSTTRLEGMRRQRSHQTLQRGSHGESPILCITVTLGGGRDRASSMQPQLHRERGTSPGTSIFPSSYPLARLPIDGKQPEARGHRSPHISASCGREHHGVRLVSLLRSKGYMENKQQGEPFNEAIKFHWWIGWGRHQSLWPPPRGWNLGDEN